jgi:hypothetical protein
MSATQSTTRLQSVPTPNAASAAAWQIALDALHAQRRALLARGIPTQTLPAEARQPLYAMDTSRYPRTLLNTTSCTVIFKVSTSKKVIWFKLDDCYYRECVQDGQPIHLTAFGTVAASAPAVGAMLPVAPANVADLDFSAATPAPEQPAAIAPEAPTPAPKPRRSRKAQPAPVPAPQQPAA